MVPETQAPPGPQVQPVTRVQGQIRAVRATPGAQVPMAPQATQVRRGTQARGLLRAVRVGRLLQTGPHG